MENSDLRVLSNAAASIGELLKHAETMKQRTYGDKAIRMLDIDTLEEARLSLRELNRMIIRETVKALPKMERKASGDGILMSSRDLVRNQALHREMTSIKARAEGRI